MIKLIAFDMDGTLLPHYQKELSDTTLRELERLQRKGYKLCIATGRPYINLSQLMGRLNEDLFYVSDNGGAVLLPTAYKSKINLTEAWKNLSDSEVAEAHLSFKHHLVDATYFPQELSLEICSELINLPDTELVLSTPFSCYMLKRNPLFIEEVEKFLDIKVKVLEDLSNLPKDIIKITLYTYQSPLLLQKEYRDRWGSKVKVAASGKHWLDFCLTNKGEGLAKLGKVLNINLEEMLAFGDNYNDVEMLSMVGHPYLMNCATDELKIKFKNQCENVTDITKKI